MTTEEELIYTIHDIVRGGIHNQDDPINERLMRSFLRLHRGKHLERYFNMGAELSDEVFQDLGAIQMTSSNGEYVSNLIPKVIRFKENYGLMANIQGLPISIVNSEEYRTSKKSRVNKYHPLLKFIGGKLYLSLGKEQQGIFEDRSNSELNTVVKSLEQGFVQKTVTINLRAVLVNPDDEPGYDFTKSPYPMPDELIEELVNSVNAREFNMFLRMKTDETGDMRDNAKAEDTSKEF
jgi:hypothetical protein